MNVSDIQEYAIHYLYDGQKAYLDQPGSLSKAFEWKGGMNEVEQLTVEGTMNNDDIASLRSVAMLAHLDISKTTLVSKQLPADAFAESRLVSFISPQEITNANGRLFADCPRLAAVVWNADVILSSNTFEGVNNPNLLVYVTKPGLKPTGVDNVVVDGVADKIILTDATSGNNNFYVPQAFTATDISYTHNYQQETVYRVTQGWETLVLPFTVQTVTHETHGALRPFDAEGEGYPFWLMELGDDKLEYAQSIEANKPYVISMPNNPSTYADQYNQKGKVTFAAKNVPIPITDLQEVTGAEKTMIPTLLAVPRASNVCALNVGDRISADTPEGSVFLSDYRDVRPFEVYMPNPTGTRRAIRLDEMIGSGTTGIFILPTKNEVNDHVCVYTLSGQLVNQGNKNEVVKNLSKGVYIINGKKVVIK